VNFTATDDVHTLGLLYESMLKEMRDAAGDSGEFYTPRAVVKFMVAVTNPRLGESVLDPACGTGGFLAEAFEHLKGQVRTIEDRQTLQHESIYGVEAKPLPYLLAQMNLLLHGLEYPNIEYQNALAVKIGEIGEADRVDVILTNPPFGGEEERKILNNFPADRQTAETALLFMQLIMRKLRRTPSAPPSSRGTSPKSDVNTSYANQSSTVGFGGGKGGGRAAVVVPNGMLFGDGIAARIKAELIQDYNLHTIVRLPEGVFAPYTGIPTNILFFDRTRPTEDIWYYEILSRDGGRYSKSKPMQFDEFSECIEWWKQRSENEHAWKVNADTVLGRNCNLDIRNPNRLEHVEHLPPDAISESILEKEVRIIEIIKEINQILENK
jgi:type I restriction enzyme M protein